MGKRDGVGVSRNRLLVKGLFGIVVVSLQIIEISYRDYIEDSIYTKFLLYLAFIFHHFRKQQTFATKRSKDHTNSLIKEKKKYHACSSVQIIFLRFSKQQQKTKAIPSGP